MKTDVCMRNWFFLQFTGMLPSKILNVYTVITLSNVSHKTACKTGSNVFVLIGILKYLFKISHCITSSELTFCQAKNWLCQF